MTQEKPEEEEAPESSKPSGNGSADQRKERVLHTRIPAVLEAELKSAARALRVPVSNLVRTILEDAVAIADRASERVEDKLTKAARTVHDANGRLRKTVVKKNPLDEVVAYQPVVMATSGECVKCEAPLDEGDDAALVVTSTPRPASFVCKACMPRR